MSQGSRNPPVHAPFPLTALEAASIRNLEDKNTRQASIDYLTLERETNIHAATMAEPNIPMASQGWDEALDDGRSIILPLAGKAIQSHILGHRKEDGGNRGWIL